MRRITMTTYRRHQHQQQYQYCRAVVVNNGNTNECTVYDLQRVCAGQVDFYRFSRFLHVNAEIEPKLAPEIISIGGRNVKCYEKN